MAKLRGEVLQLSVANVANETDDFQKYIKQRKFILIFNLLLQN
jgi:hypothetical protein